MTTAGSRAVSNGLVWIGSALYSSSISLSAAYSGEQHAVLGSGELNAMSRSMAVRLHIGHDHAGQRRDVLRVAGHAEILSDEVDVEGCPLRIPHEGLHGKADTAGTCERPWRADLETEPVADVQGGRLAQVRLGNLPSHVAVEVNVDSPRTPMSRASSEVAPLMIQPSSTR